MPYKDKKLQREAQRRAYLRNKERHNMLSNQNRAQRRVELRQLVIEHKDKTPCADCGIDYPYFVKDFDHCRDTKTGDISMMVHEVVTVERLREEIAKCDVVCANCHRLRHAPSFEER